MAIINLYKIKDIIDALGISRHKLYILRKNGDFPVPDINIGAGRWTEETINKWILSKKNEEQK